MKPKATDSLFAPYTSLLRCSISYIPLVAIFCFCGFVSKGQVNLVPNPSFEIYDTCQAFYGQIYRAVGWRNYWQDIEYFNSCANSSAPPLGVPNNVAGHQLAFQGNAYGGLECYPTTASNLAAREFVGRDLYTTLVIGQNYYVSFYVSLADTLAESCAINHIGLKFSTVPHNSSSPPILTNSAHVYTNSIITDNLNWTKISGWYIADSAYKYIMIGNFFDDANTDTTNCWAGSFYYLDYVCVSTDSLGCFIINESVVALDANIDRVDVFPNPSNEEINISSTTNKIEKIELYSIDGKLILSKNYERIMNISIAVDKLNSGIYFINIKTKKTTTIKKISILH